MCDRFALVRTFEDLAAYYGARPFGGEEWTENYNIGPAQPVPVVVEEPDGRELRLMQWGLVPFWAKDKKIGKGMIHGQAETVRDKPGFRDSFKDKRCLVPASGFYEWQKLSTVKKPSYVTPKKGLFSFAGLWSRWISPDSVELETFTILTTKANDLVKPVSDRMPVILGDDSWSAWLAKGTKHYDLEALLTPSPASGMTMVAVSKYVNALKSGGPKCIEAVDGT